MSTPPVVRQRLRVAAYAVCVRDGEVLLARFIDQPPPHWTLPGGGVEHGERPDDAVLRELTEETGHTGRIVRLLGVDSARRQYDREDGSVDDLHAIRIYYEVELTGGELRNEVGGSTDLAAWFDLEAVPALERAGLVDAGIGLRAGSD